MSTKPIDGIASLLTDPVDGKALVADGATGTMLQQRGLEPGTAPERWVMEHPDEIRRLHQGYVDAGSDIILSCTFGGTRYRLEGDGLDDQVIEVNRRAAALARAVAGNDTLVAGDMGPTGLMLAPLGTATSEEIAAAYADQVKGLVEGGVDFLLIETMSDLGEAQAAIQGARQITDLPIICTFSFDSHGRTMMGVSPGQVAREIGPQVQGIGANCGKDPAEYVAFMKAMREADPETLLWAKPNAGLPRMVGTDVVYDAAPDYMAEVALALCDAGARVIGGCCGTNPEHVSAMAHALKADQGST